MVDRAKRKAAWSKMMAVMQWGLGIFCIFFALVGGLSQNPIQAEDIVLMLVFISGGVWLLIAGTKRRMLIGKFLRYSVILADDPGGCLLNLACMTGTSEERVQANLQKMIYKNLFTGAYLDNEKHRIVFLKEAEARRKAIQSVAAGPASSQVKPSTVVCPVCGGVNCIAKGHAAECEYCGFSFISE